MDEIIAFLQSTIEDEVFSKGEKRTMKSLVASHLLDQNQLNFLRSKIYELALAKAHAGNIQFIIDWIKTANSALLVQPRESASAYFTPGEACRNVILNQIENATSRIHICVFTISDDTIANRILLAHQKGVDVRIITDNDKSEDEGSDIRQLAGVGVKVKMDATDNHMHHKFMIVDRQTVVTGSYNWTRSAFRYNHENILLTSEEGIVKSYSKEFEQLWSMMTDYSSWSARSKTK